MPENQEQLPKLFVGGDLSGIQNFLYNISSKRAAVSLKGRSHYLSKLMSKASEEVRSVALAAGASSAETETIYSSGGKFYIITENTTQVKQAITEWAQEFKRKLWEDHFGLLAFNFAFTPFNENPDGKVNTIKGDSEKCGELWRIVNAEFAKQKNRKFEDIILADFDGHFCPIPVGDSPKVCAITGVESEKCVEYKYCPPNEKEPVTMLVLPSVKEQIEEGEKLNRQDEGKSFEEYAGDTYLGVLRMDVDGLGKRFITGFKSIKAYKVFSKRLVDFFENEVKQIRKNKSEFYNFTNIIYAGGDDLFIVGRWDVIIDFAKRIHDEVESRFKEDGITISGGITIMKPKFPIAKAAEQAGEAEDEAKHFKMGDTEKNAIHFLGTTISWNEYDYVCCKKEKFVDLINNHNMSKSILHKVMLYNFIAQRNEELQKQGKPQDFSYLWHAPYYLTRFADKKPQEIMDFVRNLRDKELTGDKRKLQLVALAARWAELTIREKENQDEQNTNLQS